MMRPRTIPLKDILDELMQDPEFRAEYERLEPAYQLARLRIKRGLTQTQLAEMVGTKQSSIARLEAGNGGETLMERVTLALGAQIQIVPADENVSHPR